MLWCTHLYTSKKRTNKVRRMHIGINCVFIFSFPTVIKNIKWHLTDIPIFIFPSVAIDADANIPVILLEFITLLTLSPCYHWFCYRTHDSYMVSVILHILPHINSCSITAISFPEILMLLQYLMHYIDITATITIVLGIIPLNFFLCCTMPIYPFPHASTTTPIPEPPLPYPPYFHIFHHHSLCTTFATIISTPCHTTVSTSPKLNQRLHTRTPITISIHTFHVIP